MSKIHGMQALNLEMPERVPRTEYSVLGHPELLTRVTGIPVTKDSSPDVWRQAQRAFLKAWNFDFMWNTDIAHSIFGEYYTDMAAVKNWNMQEQKRLQRLRLMWPDRFWDN